MIIAEKIEHINLIKGTPSWSKSISKRFYSFFSVFNRVPQLKYIRVILTRENLLKTGKG